MTKVVRGHVAVVHMRAEFQSDGHGRSGRTSHLLAAKRECAGIVQSTREHVAYGFRKDVGAVEVEELAGAGSHEADMAPDVDPSGIEGRHPGDVCEQSVARFGHTRRAFLLEQRAPMRVVFDALVFSPTSVVSCEDVAAVEQSYFAVASMLLIARAAKKRS
jgi:hypothetical protein